MSLQYENAAQAFLSCIPCVTQATVPHRDEKRCWRLGDSWGEGCKPIALPCSSVSRGSNGRWVVLVTRQHICQSNLNVLCRSLWHVIVVWGSDQKIALFVVLKQVNRCNLVQPFVINHPPLLRCGRPGPSTGLTLAYRTSATSAAP